METFVSKIITLNRSKIKTHPTENCYRRQNNYARRHDLLGILTCCLTSSRYVENQSNVAIQLIQKDEKITKSREYIRNGKYWERKPERDQ